MSTDNLVPPEGATDEQFDKFIASLRREAQAEVRRLYLQGAPPDEIVEYLATLGPEPEAGATEGSLQQRRH
jgi:hypothetical protein